MVYTVNNQHVCKSEILPKWIAKIFYSRCALLYMISMFTNCEIQLGGKNPHLTKFQISEWSTFDRPVKCSSIEPKEILTRWRSNMYRSEISFCPKIFSWWPGIVSWNVSDGMQNSEYQWFLPCQSDHSLNVMTGLYFVLNKILAIYAARQMMQNVLWAEV